MASIFNGLNIAYSGLKTSQIAIDTTGHNISNAENPDYTRQRVVIEPKTPLNTAPGDMGLGAKISEIVRIHDEFVYKRLKDASSGNEYSQMRQETLSEISRYFPEIDKNGIYNAMQDYFNAWNDFSKNSGDSSLKVNLAEHTRRFTATIRDTRAQIYSVQKEMEEKLKTSVNEINRLGKEIASLNVKINSHEAGGNHANDLRDMRDKLELTLSKLVNISVSKGDLQPDSGVDRHMVESGNDYHLNIGGSSVVDGSSFHSLVLAGKNENSLFSNVFYKRQDGKKFDITNYLHGGKLGAILSLRDGEIQDVLSDMDSFSSSMIMYTNDIYASHATTSMRSNVEIDSDAYISNTDLPINNGSFYVKIYDIDGSVVAEREINISNNTKFSDIKDDINDNIDDNSDNVLTDDVDDFVVASISGDGFFQIDMKSGMAESGYKFAIEEADNDNPTLFAGVLGLSRFLDGSDARDIRLHKRFDDNPVKIGGNAAPIAGDNKVANAILELQYQKIDFYKPAGSKKITSADTLSGYFRMSVTRVADITASSVATAETSQSLLNSVVNEFDSISKVDLDEELTNLMKYQTGYSASAKVISTIDQMIQTLLGIKQ
ncbi:flagellar hook-associated protein FlgK [Hydrogenimonas sp.]